MPENSESSDLFGKIILFLIIAPPVAIGIKALIDHYSQSRFARKSNSGDDNDTTPPVTSHVFDPFIPDGENVWYVDDVEVSFVAIDDLSGVNITYYRINGGEWWIYDSPFVISDGYYAIEYYSVDNAGNEEEVKNVHIEVYKPVIGKKIIF